VDSLGAEKGGDRIFRPDKGTLSRYAAGFCNGAAKVAAQGHIDLYVPGMPVALPAGEHVDAYVFYQDGAGFLVTPEARFFLYQDKFRALKDLYMQGGCGKGEAESFRQGADVDPRFFADGFQHAQPYRGREGPEKGGGLFRLFQVQAYSVFHVPIPGYYLQEICSFLEIIWVFGSFVKNKWGKFAGVSPAIGEIGEKLENFL
jgi:hypothetical protein